MPLSHHTNIAGAMRSLKASDGHIFDVWEVLPPNHQKAKGAIVVLQEIFGLTDYIRRICAELASQGYHVIAPAIFDRVQKNVILPYNEEGVEKGLAFRAKLPKDGAARDIEAAIHFLKQDPSLKIGVLGFCWGGFLAWQAAQFLEINAASCWYGGDIAQNCDPAPHCPTELHFGAEDPMIPSTDWDKISILCPQIPLYIYENAGHGFGCTERASFHKESFLLAWERTLKLFSQNL